MHCVCLREALALILWPGYCRTPRGVRCLSAALERALPRPSTFACPSSQDLLEFLNLRLTWGGW
eukprot:15444836-Alexandrium_andersonii.AAC.1